VADVAVPSEFVVVRERARPLAPEDRRIAILDAVIPLLKERGRSVSTKQMAEAAGVAEGTLFRAFGDKESIFGAALAREFDPEPFRDKLRAIDPDEPTEDKVRRLVSLFIERFRGVIGLAIAMAAEQRPPSEADFRESTWFQVVGQIFRPGELAVPNETLAYYVRLLAFGTAIPAFSAEHPFTVDELADLVLRGVLPTPPPTPSKG
jgi:AcrR family transcriptional regulator